MSDSDAVMRAAMAALAKKVARLERRAACLEDALRKARAESVAGVLGPLRLREAVLVYFGPEPLTTFADELDGLFGVKVRNDITRHLFDLHGAPIDAAQRDAFRASFRGGMCKWSRPPKYGRDRMTTNLRFDQEEPLRLDEADSYVLALQMLYQAARVSLPRSTGAPVVEALARALQDLGYGVWAPVERKRPVRLIRGDHPC